MKKISVKNIYLLLIICIGLVCLGIGSTYAVFTASAEIENPIVISSNLTHESDIIETVEVEVPARGKKVAIFNINNTSGSVLNYSIWYLNEGNNMKTGTGDGSPTGSLGVNSKTSVKIVIMNNSSSTIKAVLGISSSKNSIVLGNNMIAVSDEPIYISSTISYDNSNTGIACEDVTCMLNELYKPDIEPGDYVSYTPSMNSYKTETSYTGYSYYQTIYPNELKLWRVLNINNDGTIEIISEHTSSTSVDFSGLTGYRNYVGYLNILASKYETEGITAGSRHFGYDGQTEFINDTSKFTSTAPWACDTTGSCNPVESQGGGDSLYLTDYNRVYNVLGTCIANKVGTTTPTVYFIASRYYSYTNNTYFSFDAKVINTSGNWAYANLYVINNSSSSQTYGRGIRPIVTLKAGLAYKGSGTSTDPWVVSK